ncbi:MAG: zinc ribbon domain-containing protein [Candidatus Pacearchaeota archaeon]
MFFIFGWGHRNVKNFGSTLVQKCPICSHTSHYSLVRTRDWATLFFIPIFSYETKYYLECPVCKNAFELENEDNIEKLKEIAELIERFDNKEVTKKELNKQYKILVKGLEKEEKGEDTSDD